MDKTLIHLEEYSLKFLDKIIIDIQAYEESKILLKNTNPYYILYNNATLTYFIISLRNLIDKKGDEKSSIPIFLQIFREQLIKNNPLGANENFIIDLESEMQKIREDSSINKYFAHLNTEYFSRLILGEEELPNIEKIITHLKTIIGEFTKLIYGTNWILQKRHTINIGII